MKRLEYDAILHEMPDNGGAYVVFPLDIRRESGKRPHESPRCI